MLRQSRIIQQESILDYLHITHLPIALIVTDLSICVFLNKLVL